MACGQCEILQAIWTPASTSQALHAFISFDNFSNQDQRNYGMWAHASNKRIHFLSSQHHHQASLFCCFGLKPRGRHEDGAYCVTRSRSLSLCLAFSSSWLAACCGKLRASSFSLSHAAQTRTLNACDATRKQGSNTHLKQKERKTRKKGGSSNEKMRAWAQETDRHESFQPALASRQRTQKRFVTQEPHRSVSVFVFLLFALIWRTDTEERKHLFLGTVWCTAPTIWCTWHANMTRYEWKCSPVSVWLAAFNATSRTLISLPGNKSTMNTWWRRTEHWIC